MGKLVNYIILLSIFLILFHLFGLVDGSTSSVLYNMLSDPQNIQNSNFKISIGVAMGLTAGAAILAGLVFSQRATWAISLGVATFMYFIVDEIVSVFTTISTQINTAYDICPEVATLGPCVGLGNWIAMLAIAPMGIVAALAIFEWWLGGMN